MEWLIGLAVLGVLLGAGGGYAMARNAGKREAGRTRELEAALADAQQELENYRQEVAAQFSETARKFQTLNDSYTDLHRQLAHSASVLCGDVTGPLLEAPAGHQDLIPAEVREGREVPERGGVAAGADDGEAAEALRGKRDEDARASGAEEPGDRGLETAPTAGVSEREEVPTLQDTVPGSEPEPERAAGESRPDEEEETSRPSQSRTPPEEQAASGEQGAASPTASQGQQSPPAEEPPPAEEAPSGDETPPGEHPRQQSASRAPSSGVSS